MIGPVVAALCPVRTLPRLLARLPVARPLLARLPVALALPLLVALPGCTGFLHARTGAVMSSYTHDHIVPHLMESTDVDSACQLGAAMGPFIASFERVTDRPDLPVLVASLAAAMCAEATVREADLANLRAVRDARGAAAKDAQIRLERAHALAAQRFHDAWLRADRAFGGIGNSCPKLESQDDGLYLLLGMAAGVLAVLHDRAAQAVVGVPTDIPARVARTAECLDAKTWWGVPWALQVAIWWSLPGGAPAGIDAEKRLGEAQQLGEAAHVRLAHAFAVRARAANGDDKGLRAAIEAHAKAMATPGDPRWKLLDSYAAVITLHESDRLWTRQLGHRTPSQRLGQWPIVPGAAQPAENDEFLDDVAPAEEGAGEPATEPMSEPKAESKPEPKGKAKH